MSALGKCLAPLFALTLTLAACSEGSSDPELLPPADGGTTVPEFDASPDGGAHDGGPRGCGNGKLEQGEACDDGNRSSDDGCSASCLVESAFEGDSCPGVLFPLTASGPLYRGRIPGSTVAAYNHFAATCGGGSGRDVVFELDPPSSGSAKVTLTANYPAIVSARSTCDDAQSESKCVSIPSPKGGAISLDVSVFAGAPLFLVVDGYGGTSGEFTLDVELREAVCGNGIAEVPEKCDDGNTQNGDGCSSSCALEQVGILGSCPGQPYVMSGPPGAPRKVSFAGNTLTDGKPSHTSAGCFFDGGNNTVYALKADIAGSVRAELVTDYPRSTLHARSDCTSEAYQLGCANALAPGTLDIEFPVAKDAWFYVIVDGQGASTTNTGGLYSVSVVLRPSACGNHVLDGDEECDDGNALAGDGCTPECRREPLDGLDTCPGHAVALTAQADGSRTAVVSGTTAGLANDVRPCQAISSTSAPDAIFAVTPDIDGLLSLDLRAPFNGTISVLDRCAAPIGERSAVLACSYASWVPPLGKSEPWVIDGLGSGPKSTAAAVLANHTYYVVVDGSSSNGKPSAGPFEVAMRVTAPVCGNGTVEGTETCDDGTTESGDGCTASCQLEPTGPRNTCATAESVVFDEKAPDTWSASIQSGTTNLTGVHNFGSSEAAAGACWARGRDAYFKVVAPGAGVLRATARSNAFDVIVGMQVSSCATTTAPANCANTGPKGIDETLAAPVAAGDVIYLVVDSPLPGVNGCTSDPISSTFAADCAKLEERGRFSLEVTLSPSGCGDGFFVPGPAEKCDDGNVANGDGCSATCELEPLAGVDTCPGTALVLHGAGAEPRSGVMTFSTTNLAADYSGACGGNGRDGVVRVVPTIGGQLTARLKNVLRGTVYARAVCSDPQSEFFKSTSATCPGVVHDAVSFPVEAATEYFLFVDGFDGAAGVPTLEVTVTP